MASKKGSFSSELAVLRGHFFSISLAVFKDGWQISSSWLGRKLYMELSPRAYVPRSTTFEIDL